MDTYSDICDSCMLNHDTSTSDIFVLDIKQEQDLSDSETCSLDSALRESKYSKKCILNLEREKQKNVNSWINNNNYDKNKGSEDFQFLSQFSLDFDDLGHSSVYCESCDGNKRRKVQKEDFVDCTYKSVECDSTIVPESSTSNLTVNSVNVKNLVEYSGNCLQDCSVIPENTEKCRVILERTTSSNSNSDDVNVNELDDSRIIRCKEQVKIPIGCSQNLAFDELSHLKNHFKLHPFVVQSLSYVVHDMDDFNLLDNLQHTDKSESSWIDGVMNKFSEDCCELMNCDKFKNETHEKDALPTLTVENVNILPNVFGIDSGALYRLCNENHPMDDFITQKHRSYENWIIDEHGRSPNKCSKMFSCEVDIKRNNLLDKMANRNFPLLQYTCKPIVKKYTSGVSPQVCSYYEMPFIKELVKDYCSGGSVDIYKLKCKPCHVRIFRDSELDVAAKSGSRVTFIESS